MLRINNVFFVFFAIFIATGCSDSQKYKYDDLTSGNSLDGANYDSYSTSQGEEISLNSEETKDAGLNIIDDYKERLSAKKDKFHNPLDKKSRVAVIGAGPAGVTAACVLKKNGYSNVTIFEKNNYIGGRCFTSENNNDLGAICFFYNRQNSVVELSDSLSIPKRAVNKVIYYNLDKGIIENKGKHGLTPIENLKSDFQGAQYIFNRNLKWRELRKPYLNKISPELFDTWGELVKRKSWNDFHRRISLITVGFGYPPNVPALYYARYIWLFDKRMFKSGDIGLWAGGTQQIWRKYAETNNIDVRLNSNISSITRDGAVKVKFSDSSKKDDDVSELEFDNLVIACNPTHIMNVLDCSKKEKELFSKIKTVDYRVYELEIDNFMDGEQIWAGVLSKNIHNNIEDRPLAFVRNNFDTNIFVAYVNASGKVSDEVIKNNIKEDLVKLNGKPKRFLNIKHWPYFPHVDGDALKEGFYQEMEKLQGKSNTVLVGSYLTFDTMFHAADQSSDTIHKLISGRYDQ